MWKSFGFGAGVWRLVLGLPWLAACGSGADSGSDNEPVGQATLQLTTVPSGAQCLQVIGAGASAFNVTSALTGGASSSSIGLSRLPLGSSTITANVFDVACSAIAGAQPSWVADPQPVTFRAGVPANLTLTFRQQNPLVVSANFVGNIADFSLGSTATGLVLGDGTVRVTGSNWYPLGGSSTFTNPGTLSAISAIAAPRGGNHGCARSGGSLQCWGYNSSGQLGTSVALGTWSGPVTISGIFGATTIAVGAQHTCALVGGGGVQCLGGNAYSQLGNGTTTNSSSPTRLGVPTSSKLAAGFNFTCSAGDNLYCWGDNVYGELANGTTSQQTTPTYIALTGIVSISAGYAHACVVRADGTVRCWGYNGFGQLGDGTYTNRLTPTQVPGITDAAEVAAGVYHTCIRHQDGTVSCFGMGDTGALGNGLAEASRPTPAKVPGVAGAIKISSGYGNTCVLTDAQQLLCWGSNDAGELGDALLDNHYKPTPAIIQ